MTPPLVKRYIITFERHKLLGLASFALITGISGVVAIQPPPPPTYSAEGVLAYNMPAKLFSETGGQIQELGRQLTPDILLAENVVKPAAEQAKLKPRDIAEKVDIELPRAGKKGEPPPPQIIRVSFSDDNPNQAGLVVDVLMKKMVEQSRLINTARLRATIEAIDKRLPEAKKELREVEQKLERYDRIEGPALFAAEDGTLVGGITGSQEQQRQIQLTLQGVETQINSLVRKLGLNPDQAYTSSALSADPIIANLRAQILQIETQIEILSRDLRPEHPQMIALRKQQQSYEMLLQQRASEVLGGGGMLTPLPAKFAKIAASTQHGNNWRIG